MRPRTAPALSALVLAAMLLGGCTSSDSDDGQQAGDSPSAGSASSNGSSGDPAPNAPAGPACEDVWAVGQDLPADYTECAAGSAQGTQDVTECLDDTQLIVFDDSLWAVTGGEVVEPEASPLQDTEAYGAAYSECTGE